jgi:hypothetical protein
VEFNDGRGASYEHINVRAVFHLVRIYTVVSIDLELSLKFRKGSGVNGIPVSRPITMELLLEEYSILTERLVKVLVVLLLLSVLELCEDHCIGACNIIQLFSW